ncbi:MAG: hypothetical protein ACJ76P_02585 [Actinomycetota bacterium]
MVVTGTTHTGNLEKERSTTVSYDARSGATQWKDSQTGGYPVLAVGSSRVFVGRTGIGREVALASAYSAASGELRWNIAGPVDTVTGIALDEVGGHLFLSGLRVRHPGGQDFETLGLRTSDGHEIWR